MCEHALEALAESKVKRVQVVGRRGPLQVAFTIKELREMSKLPSCKTLINPSDFDPIRDLIQGIAILFFLSFPSALWIRNYKT